MHFSLIIPIFAIMKKMLLLLIVLMAVPLAINAQRKRAFMVGISTYRANGRKAWDNIHGANDVDLLKDALQKKGFQVWSVINEQATYECIKASLATFIDKTKKGDIVYLHFSCHGQPVEDGLIKGYAKGDEQDGWDEALVPIDAGKVYGANGYRGEKHLTDDELNVFFSRLRSKMGTTGKLCVVMDACHIGESSRIGLETVRGTSEGLTRNPSLQYNPPRSHVRHFFIEKGKDLAHVLFLEACRSHERNTEILVDGKEYGALSYHVFLVLSRMTSLEQGVLVFKTLIEQAVRESGKWPRTQTMVTESSF